MPSPNTDTSTSSAWLVALWTSVPVTLAISAGVFMVVPQFQQVFSSFGTSLPWLTGLVSAYTGLVFALPALALVLALVFTGLRLAGRKQAAAPKAAVMVVVLSAVLLAILVGVALYLPVLQISQPVE